MVYAVSALASAFLFFQLVLAFVLGALIGKRDKNAFSPTFFGGLFGISVIATDGVLSTLLAKLQQAGQYQPMPFASNQIPFFITLFLLSFAINAAASLAGYFVVKLSEEK